MSKSRNKAPTNMDTLFDVPYEETALSTLPRDLQAELICGCGFFGVRNSDVVVNLPKEDLSPSTAVDGPSVSLEERARNLIEANFELSNRNMAEGRVKQDNTAYGPPVIRYNTAALSAKKYFQKAFGVDELIASGMSRDDALKMAADAWLDYDNAIGGTGSIAKKRVKLTEIQKKILHSL